MVMRSFGILCGVGAGLAALGCGGSGGDGTGLEWQTVASDAMRLEEAAPYCANLTLDGHDDWRLPTISELRTLVAGCDPTAPGGTCGIDEDCLAQSCWDDSCANCSKGKGATEGCYWSSGLKGECGGYWSASPAQGFDGAPMWVLAFDIGGVQISYGREDLGAGLTVIHRLLVRCVRG